MAKEAAGTISSAYATYKLETGASGTMSPGDLTPLMNYVRVDTSSQIDYLYGNGAATCSANDICLVLHNGAVLKTTKSTNFAGTSSTNAVEFYLDPDGKSSGTTNGPGKSIVFELYYDGSLRTYGTAKDPSCGSWACPFNPAPSSDPPWFSWN